MGHRDNFGIDGNVESLNLMVKKCKNLGKGGLSISPYVCHISIKKKKLEKKEEERVSFPWRLGSSLDSADILRHGKISHPIALVNCVLLSRSAANWLWILDLISFGAPVFSSIQ